MPYVLHPKKNERFTHSYSATWVPSSKDDWRRQFTPVIANCGKTRPPHQILTMCGKNLDEIYEHEDLQPDSLTELLRQLTVYRLFWARDSKSPPVSPVHQQRWVVDIHELGGLKEVTSIHAHRAALP